MVIRRKAKQYCCRQWNSFKNLFCDSNVVKMQVEMQHWDYKRSYVLKTTFHGLRMLEYFPFLDETLVLSYLEEFSSMKVNLLIVFENNATNNLCVADLCCHTSVLPTLSRLKCVHFIFSVLNYKNCTKSNESTNSCSSVYDFPQPACLIFKRALCFHTFIFVLMEIILPSSLAIF